MELSLPEFPAEPGAQAAFVAVCLLLCMGMVLLAFPVSAGRFLGLESRDSRPGAIGELRAAGGLLAGLAFAALMFEQPVLYTVLAVALGVSTFGRIVSLMSDSAATWLNFLLLTVQVVLTGATLYYFFDVVTPEMQLVMPEPLDARLVFFTYAAIAVFGALIMFGPRLSMAICGLGVTGEKASAISTIRSAGGFALGLGLIGLLLMGNADNAPMDMLMGNLGVAAALGLAMIGRLIALALNRGNSIFAAVALVIEGAAAAVVISSVSSMM
jgi:hypothetical protein